MIKQLLKFLPGKDKSPGAAQKAAAAEELNKINAKIRKLRGRIAKEMENTQPDQSKIKAWENEIKALGG